jgi:hypothetical protein
LETARVLGQALADQQPTVGVDIVLFDAEDYGTQPGTKEYTPKAVGIGFPIRGQTAKANGYTAKFGILLDMVGDTNPLFLWEQYSLQFAQSVVGKVWSTAASLGYNNLFHPGGVEPSLTTICLCTG